MFAAEQPRNPALKCTGRSLHGQRCKHGMKNGTSTVCGQHGDAHHRLILLHSLQPITYSSMVHGQSPVQPTYKIANLSSLLAEAVVSQCCFVGRHLSALYLPPSAFAAAFLACFSSSAFLSLQKEHSHAKGSGHFHSCSQRPPTPFQCSGLSCGL